MNRRIEQVFREHEETPIPDKEQEVLALQAEVAAGRTTAFSRAFLQYLLENPTLDLATAWEDVERYFAEQSNTQMRRNPYLPKEPPFY